MDFKDYYTTLGVPKTASEKDIKQAFRKLARKYHPDVNPGDKGAEARFKEVNEANEVLSDPQKRKKYDELGANWRAYEQAEAQGGPNPFAGRWNVNMGGGGAGQSSDFRTMTPEEMEEMFGDQNPFSDFFTTFFGGDFGATERPSTRGPRSRTRTRQGRDVEHEIELTLAGVAGLAEAGPGSAPPATEDGWLASARPATDFTTVHVRVGFFSRARAMAAMCSGVLPLQPPAMLQRWPSANSPMKRAMSSGPRSKPVGESGFGRPAFG